MADWSGIRAAIATQYGTVSALRESTSTDLSQAGMLPALKVERVSSIELNAGRGGRGAGFEARLARVAGKLLMSRAADIGRAQVDVEAVVEDLYEAARTGLRLGYSGIVEDSWLDRVEIGEVEFGGVTYYGADLEWVVEIIEEVTRTS